MKILLRNNQRKEWQKLEPRVYGKEHQLEELLAESPDLLPGEESERVIFFKRQVPLGQNAVDLLGVTSAGSITVVECKLDCNREARRTVIAQILEYGSQLWGMEYDEFEGLLSQGREEPLADTVRRLAGPGWSEEAFVAGAKRALVKCCNASDSSQPSSTCRALSWHLGSPSAVSLKDDYRYTFQASVSKHLSRTGRP